MRVVLADDEVRVRSALGLLLEQQPNLTIVGEAAESDALLVAVRATQPDAVLMDWELPGMPAVQVIQALQQAAPGILIIALSGRPEARQLALAAGADGFVSKVEPPERVLTLLRRVSGERERGHEQG